MGNKRRVLECGENLLIVQYMLVRKCPYTAQYCAQLNENQRKYTNKRGSYRTLYDEYNKCTQSNL